VNASILSGAQGRVDAVYICAYNQTSMDALDALADVLTAISENPFDISLHAKHINLATEAGEDATAEAREMMTAYWPAGDEVWLPLINAKAQAIDVNSVAGAREVHELFERAEGDYLGA
jgi:squamous cell carcinoma antigen recognized by T-cells 3